ncbi:hypothetical protein Dda_4334 [Drechslerella dactyloides]|uniref:F-box domain-containing protein n=1 Tax=Drechslerella dactyloides TaxID=74499 RepID=A0AAD6IWU0_DREDA|nr:hypothetical protein Dda_4334 [Drechslerella dactyloides]
MGETRLVSTSSEEPTSFNWGNLPLELARLILDNVEWPSHSICRQVCHDWRLYFDEPRQISKRYHTPKYVYRVIHKVTEAGGMPRLRMIEHPEIKVRGGHQIHRILGEPGLGFFLYIDDKTRDVKHRPGYYFAISEQGSKVSNRNETDLRGYFPEPSDGLLMHPSPANIRAARSRSAQPKASRVLGGLPAGYVTGAWCVRLDHLPFGDELAVMTQPEKFEVQVLLTSYSGKRDTLTPRIAQWLNDSDSRPLTLQRLVLGVRDIVAQEIVKNMRRIRGDMFVRFSGMVNLPQSLTAEVLTVSLEIWVQDGFSWVNCDSRKYKSMLLGEYID